MDQRFSGGHEAAAAAVAVARHGGFRGFLG